MKQVDTFYDYLGVTRNAPPEVIRAAYKALSQKYHPDKNPDNPDFAQAMIIINRIYTELSDPIKRRQYDQWLAKQEQATPAPPLSRMSPHAKSKLLKEDWLAIAFLLFLILCALIAETKHEESPPTAPNPYLFNSPKAQPIEFADPSSSPEEPESYSRPAKAPNGQPWPNTSDYIKGYDQLNSIGLSTVTVDNSKNDSDVFVKLVSLNGDKSYPVRLFFILAGSTFTLKNVSQGSYDIRYRDLNSGDLARSESFRLEQVRTYNGTQFSNLRMTLYKVQNGNMQTYGLSETDF